MSRADNFLLEYGEVLYQGDLPPCRTKVKAYLCCGVLPDYERRTGGWAGPFVYRYENKQAKLWVIAPLEVL